MDLGQLLLEPKLLRKLGELEGSVLVVQAVYLLRQEVVGDVASGVGLLGQAALLLEGRVDGFEALELLVQSVVSPGRQGVRLLAAIQASHGAVAQDGVAEGLLDEVFPAESVIV
jgi:hypothetical protein